MYTDRVSNPGSLTYESFSEEPGLLVVLIVNIPDKVLESNLRIALETDGQTSGTQDVRQCKRSSETL